MKITLIAFEGDKMSKVLSYILSIKLNITPTHMLSNVLFNRLSNTLKAILCLLFLSSLIACSTFVENNTGEPQWDFDHQLQFNQTQLLENTYHLEITPNDRARFSTISTFIIRRGFKLCRTYGFKIEVLKGVEGFDDKRSHPNMITERFAANIECPIKEADI